MYSPSTYTASETNVQRLFRLRVYLCSSRKSSSLECMSSMRCMIAADDGPMGRGWGEGFRGEACRYAMGRVIGYNTIVSRRE